MRRCAHPSCHYAYLCIPDFRQQVEGEAQGSLDAIKQFLKQIDDGPTHARVVKLDKEERDLQEGESSFEVRR